MCSVVEIKNQDEYYIHYHSPESLESQVTEEEASLGVVEELFKRDNNEPLSLASSIKDSSLGSELRHDDDSIQGKACEEVQPIESIESFIETKDQDFSMENVEVPSATTEKPVVQALAVEVDVSSDGIIGRQIFDGILHHRLGQPGSTTELSVEEEGHVPVEMLSKQSLSNEMLPKEELSNKVLFKEKSPTEECKMSLEKGNMSLEKGRVLEELETEVQEIKRIFNQSNGWFALLIGLG